MRIAAHNPSGPGGMRMSRKTTLNSRSSTTLSLTAATASSAPLQKWSSNRSLAASTAALAVPNNRARISSRLRPAACGSAPLGARMSR